MCLEHVLYSIWGLLGMGYKTIVIILFGLVTTAIAMYKCLSLMPSIDWTIKPQYFITYLT